MSILLQRRKLFVSSCVLAIGCIVAVVGLQLTPLGAVDDAYITYRYAENLANGFGLVYNAGEWVLGTTTPLYALALALGGYVFGNIPALGHWLGITAWIAAASFAMGMLWQLHRPLAGVFAGILLVLNPSLLSSVGMETPLVVALMFGVAWAVLAGKRWIAVPCAAALILMRQDATLWIILLGIWMWYERKHFPLLEVSLVVALTTPWFLFAYLRYGMILPNSAIAKIGQTSTMAVGGESAFLGGVAQNIQGDLGVIFLLLVVCLSLLGVYVIGVYVRSLWWMPIWLVAYTAIYSLLGVANFGWYFVPLLSAIALLCALGMEWLLLPPKGGGSRHMSAASYVRISVGAIFAVSLMFGYFLQLQAGIARWHALETHSRLRDYHALGAWLGENAAEGESVAALEIGIIGYQSQLPVVDLMGLVTPALRTHLTGWQDVAVYAVTTFWPEYFVAVPQMAVVQQWWFADNYAEAAKFGDITLYRRLQMPSMLHVERIDATYIGGLDLEQVAVNSQRLDQDHSLDIWATLHISQKVVANYQFTWSLVDVQDYSRPVTANLWPYGDFNLYQSSHWQPGDRLQIPFRLQLPSDLRDGTYRLSLVIYDTAQNETVPLSGDDKGHSSDEVGVSWLRVGDPEALVALPGQHVSRVDAGWENLVRLESITMPTAPVSAGTEVVVDLQWSIKDSISRDLTVYVHVVDSDGKVVTQNDQKPYNGRFPTPVWQVGEHLRDRHVLTLPPNMPIGSYRLCVGLYDGSGRIRRSDVGENLDETCDLPTLEIE